MKTFLECVPCLVRQAHEATLFATDDLSEREDILRGALRRIADIRMDQSPPHMAAGLHQMIRRRLNGRDPYREVKSRSNQAALALYDQLSEYVKKSDDPFGACIRLAIAGNVIDFGAPDRPELESLMDVVEQSLTCSLFGHSVDALKRVTDRAEHVLVLGDNAGEIVFDRLLMEQISFAKCTYAVKGVPVINDVTRTDADEAGLTGVVEVIDNGSNAPGTVLEWCASAFLDRLRQSDVVIAKGQGNYETLSGAPIANLYFLLRAKCSVIARHIGCEIGDFVIQSTTGE